MPKLSKIRFQKSMTYSFRGKSTACVCYSTYIRRKYKKNASEYYGFNDTDDPKWSKYIVKMYEIISAISIISYFHRFRWICDLAYWKIGAPYRQTS